MKPNGNKCFEFDLSFPYGNKCFGSAMKPNGDRYYESAVQPNGDKYYAYKYVYTDDTPCLLS
jgi:hypothetical protein